jgi:photosystem II stability/assembly factor-like uncharacterized protein
MEGVAVGDHFPIGGGDTLPKIRFTNDTLQGFGLWSEDVDVVGTATFMNQKGLREVAWAGGTDFWAVGQGGLILKSTDGGQTWNMQEPESRSTLGNLDLEGVAFVDETLGVFVGRRPVSSVVQGVAYQYKDLGGGSISWTQLSLPSGVTINGLTDVAISGSEAWVVGEKSVSGATQGIVLKSTLSSGSFGAFSEDAPSGGIAACVTGEALAASPVLSEVEVAPNTGDIWIGGACGRLWSKRSTGWTEVKSGTDAHVVGLSFAADGSGARGFVGGYRDSQTQQCITSVQ